MLLLYDVQPTVSLHVTYGYNTRGADVLCEGEANSVWWGFVSPSGCLIKRGSGSCHEEAEMTRVVFQQAIGSHVRQEEEEEEIKKKKHTQASSFYPEIKHGSMSEIMPITHLSVWHPEMIPLSTAASFSLKGHASVKVFLWMMHSRRGESSGGSARQQHEQPSLSSAWDEKTFSSFSKQKCFIFFYDFIPDWPVNTGV